MNIDSLIAARVKSLRKEHKYTLDTLADRSGISRAMISLIERGEANPTAVVLNKLADALGVPLPDLLSENFIQETNSSMMISKFEKQKLWKDPESGYTRRQLTPQGSNSNIKLTEIIFPPKQSVSFENLFNDILITQQIWVLSGEMEISDNTTKILLKEGDCIEVQLNDLLTFSNQSNKQARYLIALSNQPLKEGDQNGI
ncbi:helix-turn-helix domain-containing protein [Acinetobacter sp. S40]|uniref:helix-turn-helix domain-containing protein n=1 Tax=Acinetobacter sp. S40 TaxID=2767434 RepID=UPI00190BFBE6|nr:helix-turn-helix domain-containing protein [Acinetobacter sp. S40]MBJ9985911.1 helix-turn-helix domain-containing protein [Acinetobacter sp. S40]